MSLEILERIKMNNPNPSVVLKTVKNGNLIVKKVPHIPFPDGQGPDGEHEYLPADVMYNLSKIFRHMLDNNISTFTYNDFK